MPFCMASHFYLYLSVLLAPDLVSSADFSGLSSLLITESSRCLFYATETFQDT